VAPLAFAETYAQAVESTTGITHFWPMEESSGSSFADLVGGADASISGGVSLGEPGGLAEESHAALFNGSSGAAQAELDLSATHKLTVEFWMKWSAFADNDSLAMEFTPNFNEAPGGFLVDPNASSGNFGVGVGEGSTRNNVYFERPSAETWHHYAFVIDTEASGEEEITPYIDGQPVSYSKTESHTGGGFANSTLYWMSRNASSLFGAGAMQDLAIYGQALSAGEVLEHYEVGAGPTNTAPPVIFGAAEVGAMLRASTGTWTGSPTPSYTYQWQLCEADGSRCADIDGATSANYNVESADLEGALRVTVTASNIAGGARAASEPSEEVTLGPPSELSAPAIEGTEQVGQALQGDPGDWGGSEPQLSYQWQLCEADGSGCADIANATKAEYELSSGEVGHAVRLEVGASNDLGSVAAISRPTIPVESESTLLSASTPEITGVPQVGQLLTVTTGSWLGIETPGYAYQWQRCDEDGEGCADIEGASEADYEAAGADEGYVLRVLVRASEEHATAAAVSTPTNPIIAAGAPVALAAPIASGSPLVGQPLTTSDGEWSGEEALSYAYQWERCDQHGGKCASIAEATSAEYTPSSSDVDATLRAHVTATDGEERSSSATSGPLLVGAVALQELALPSQAGPHQVGRSLQASPGIWTGAGAIVFTYQWQRCSEAGESCASIEGANEVDYVPDESDVDHALRVRVHASTTSESEDADSAPTAAITAGPIAPENEAPPLIEGYVTEGNVLTAQAGKWLSSEAIAYAYQWLRCDAEGEGCANIEGATEATYELTEADVGSTLEVRATASNELGSVEVTSEVTEGVAAPGPPVSSEAPTILGDAMEGSQLAVDNGEWTGTRPLHYIYQWRRCDAEGEACSDIEGATNPSYIPSSGDVGSRMRVLVTVKNTLGVASVESDPTDAILLHESAGATHAIELTEEVDPSALAKAEPASAEEQTVTPALTDPGEELHATGTLTSIEISKDTPGELALNTAGGEISLALLDTAPSASAMPTVANETAAVFAGTFADADTIVRPDALGATTLLQLHSAQSPTSFSWELGLGVDQQLEVLPDGSVAVVEASALSLEGPLTEVELAAEAEGGETEEEGYVETGAEEDLEGAIGEEGPLEKLSAAPQVTTSAFTPSPSELQPQDTAAQYERERNALSYAEAHAAGVMLAVIAPPTVLDAEGDPIPAHLSVEGVKLTLSITPEGEVSYPLTASESAAAPTDQATAATAHTVRYGLSDGNAPVFERLDPRLTNGSGDFHIGIARYVVAYNTAAHTDKLNKLISWLKAVGKAGLRPYLTLGTLGSLGREFCNSSCPAPNAGHYKSSLLALVNALHAARAMEQKHNEEGSSEQVIPSVELWGAWNEPDLNLNKLEHRDPLFDKPGLAARYWEIAQSSIPCSTCRVIAGEFAEGSEKDHVKYIEEYMTHILHDRYHRSGKPRNVGFHDYHDLVHVPESLHGYTNSAARGFVKLVKRRFGGHAHILLSEQAVELSNGHEPTRLARSGHRQLLAAEDFLKLGQVSRNIDMLDYHEYRGPDAIAKSHNAHAFDSGLRAGEGTAPANLRPAYCYLVLGLQGCPSSAEGKLSCTFEHTTGAAGFIHFEYVCDAVPTSETSPQEFGDCCNKFSNATWITEMSGAKFKVDRKVEGTFPQGTHVFACGLRVVSVEGPESGAPAEYLSGGGLGYQEGEYRFGFNASVEEPSVNASGPGAKGKIAIAWWVLYASPPVPAPEAVECPAE
jgi:hypothetical protein